MDIGLNERISKVKEKKSRKFKPRRTDLSLRTNPWLFKTRRKKSTNTSRKRSIGSLKLQPITITRLEAKVLMSTPKYLPRLK